MPFQTNDAVTEEVVRDRLEEIVQETLGIRMAFRETQVPDDVGETWKIPQSDDVIGKPDTIQPGGEYPATEEGYSKIEIDRQKYGFRMEFLDEAVMDNTSFDVIADQVDRAGRQFAELLNDEAYTELSNNLNASSSVGATGDLSRTEYLKGVSTLEGTGYQPDLLLLNEDGLEELRQDQDFVRATDMGDNIVRTGEMPTADGLNIVLDTSGNLGDDEAYVVDTDFYGYEAVWEDVEVEADREFNTDKEVRKARSYRQWKAMDAGAAIEVNTS